MGPFWFLSGGCRGQGRDRSRAATGPRRGWGPGPGPLGEGARRPPFQRRGGKPRRFAGGVRWQSGAVTVNRPDTRPDTNTSVATTAPRQTSVTLRGERCPFAPGRPSPPSALPGRIHLHGGKWRPGVEEQCPGPPLMSAVEGHPCYFSSPGPDLLSGFWP